MTELKPFVKWAGGKRGLLPELRTYFPDKFDTYVEPFLGGGAVMCDILTRTDVPIYANDVNVRLINVYLVLMDSGLRRDMFGILACYQQEWSAGSPAERKAMYYRVRNVINQDIGRNRAGMAAAFVFLNKTCFNGLWRENMSGQFNVPVGDMKDKQLYDADELTALGQAMTGRVVFKWNNYFETAKHAGLGSFYYLDPPYGRVAGQKNFTAYNKEGFSDMEQRDLRKFCEMLDKAGAKFLMSNADTGDNFFENLYAGFNITKIQAPRSVSADGKLRGKVSELLISNY